MRKATVALGVLLLCGLLPSSPSAAVSSIAGVSGSVSAAPAGQFRAYWVDAFGEGLYTPAQIDDVVAATKAARMNAIVAQIVRRGDCFCNRALAPRTETAGVDPAPFDPLQTLIDKAHAQGIQVHAWVIATSIWRGSTAPASPDHVYNLHGPSTSGTANWLTRRSDGLQQVSTDWLLDPGHPDAAQWVVDNALSIVRSYNVDGINLDRIRYPDNNLGTNVPSWGYNDTAVARFNASTGRTGVPANTDAQWTQWRRDQITSIVRKIYIESFAIRPSVSVSVDTITYGYGPQHGSGFTGTRTYAEVLQDWDGWMREGIVDLNIPMSYKRQADANQSLMYQEWSDFSKDHQYARSSVIGAALYLNDVNSSTQQARVAIASSTAGSAGAGWAGYSYRTPDSLTNDGLRSGADSRAALTAALATVFTSDMPVPAMTWKTQPTLGHVRGATTANAPVALVLSTGQTFRTQTSDGRGWFAFVDVPPGTYTVTASGAVLGYTLVSSGQISGISAAPTPTPSPTPVPTPTPSPSPTPPPGTCTSSVGPGIPPPASIPAGIPGFHAAWYGQSGYMTMCPGTTSVATVAYYNAGARGWVSGRMGEVAYLGTWSPEPGQDMASPLGGDGTMGSPNTGWPRYNRIAIQPAPYVGPGQVSWFQFTVKAPATPGTYRLYLRPLVEGAQWMEDYGVFWLVTVRS